MRSQTLFPRKNPLSTGDDGMAGMSNRFESEDR